MAGYRVVAGYGELKRENGEHAVDLPKKADKTTTASPSEIFASLST